MSTIEAVPESTSARGHHILSVRYKSTVAQWPSPGTPVHQAYDSTSGVKSAAPLIDDREINEEYLVFRVLTFDRPEIRTLGDPDVCDHLFDLDWMDREVTIWAHRTDVWKTISRRVQNWIAFHIPETGNQNNAGGRGAHQP